MTPIHHFFVHFPIALLVVAALADLAGVALKRSILTRMAFILLVLAGIGGIPAAVTGNHAETNIRSQEALVADVQQELNAHVGWGNTLVWIILAVAASRVFFLLEKKPIAMEGWLFPVMTTLLAAAVLFTGLLGGQLSQTIFTAVRTLP